jgi:NAD(P)-dependent dehydrogenase (short-subunit alcohol dehydrogenase family)
MSARTGAPALAGRHAVVTGGGHGIGGAIAGALAGAGADVTIMGRAMDVLTAHAARLARDHGVRVSPLRVDVTDEAEVAAGFARARERLGDVAILVNNAGLAGGGAFTELRRADWDRVFAVNVTGALLCTQQVLPAMLSAGAGRIVNIASTAGLRGVPRIAPYVASKHALVGLTRSLALEVAKRGVTVNVVCPGYTDTDMARQAVDAIVAGTGKPADEALGMITRVSPLNRLIRPEEVAATVLWLCSEDAAAITAQAIVIGVEA